MSELHFVQEESGQEADNNTVQAQDNTTASHDNENRTQVRYLVCRIRLELILVPCCVSSTT